MNRPSFTSRLRGRAALTTAGLLGAACVVLAGTAVAAVSYRSVQPPPPSPTSADQIQNIDQVKTAIKGYYGDTVTTTLDPYTGTTALHTFSPTSAYANELGGLTKRATNFLKSEASAKKGGVTGKAVVFDIDDTLLNTYNYEIYSNFVYNPASNAAFVNSAAFPAVPHMPALVNYAAAQGYTVLLLTGRPATQLPGTVTNLAQAGYPSVPSDHLVLKDYTGSEPWLASCAPTCTTIQYKSLTREHFQDDLGYKIVADFGDQYSDLTGGYSGTTFKVPNPMYYLP